jgi:GLPGLI family protein
MKNFDIIISNKQNFILFIALSFSLSLIGQRFDYEYTEIEPVELVVTYTLKHMKDTTNPSFIRHVYMLLLMGQSTSMFIGKEMYSVDTIKRKMKSREEIQEFYMDKYRPFPKFNYRIYKNYPNGKLTFIEHVIGGTFKFEEDLDLFNWQLQGDTATINGYKAQKATCDFGGRSWVAWFSPEIPYNDGPYKFNGLPGLIVKIGDTREHYVFGLITIKKPEKEIVIDMKEKDYIVSTKQGFFRAKDAFRDDIINRAKEAGLSSKDQQTAARNMAMKNNPIELIRK